MEFKLLHVFSHHAHFRNDDFVFQHLAATGVAAVLFPLPVNSYPILSLCRLTEISTRSGADMSAQTLAISYALAIGTACPLAFGLGKVRT